VEVSITRFRRELFNLVEAAMQGEQVSFVHKGVRFKLMPEKTTDRLAHLTPLQIINPNYPDLDTNEMKAEMEREMEADWQTL
jgi:hypothetical protein